jgi:hypothetical protein
MCRTVRCELWLSLLLLASVGCHHPISFHKIGYGIGTEKHDASLVVVIAPATLNQTVTIRSFMTGIANSWDAKPGMMLKQVADVEFPQMFKHYEIADILPERIGEDRHFALELTVPRYVFADFRASVTIRAAAYGPGNDVILDKTYTEQGIAKGGKMFGAGAFGMKSAVRQSSFDAYKKIFSVLRADLIEALSN